MNRGSELFKVKLILSPVKIYQTGFFYEGLMFELQKVESKVCDMEVKYENTCFLRKNKRPYLFINCIS